MQLKVVTLMLSSLLVTAGATEAADKTHQQMMAEIRMLQEQQQQLAAMLGGLADTLKTVTTRMDDQTNASERRSRIRNCWSTASPKACVF